MFPDKFSQRFEDSSVESQVLIDIIELPSLVLDSITFKMEAVEQPHNLLTELTIKTCMTVKSDTHNWKTFCPHHSLCLHHSLYL